MTTTELIQAAVDRGETFESMGAGKASKSDLSHYVLEIVREANDVSPVAQIWEGWSDGQIAGALFAIWTDGTPNE